MIQSALKWAPNDDHERREEPQPRAQAVAAEQHQAEEAALEEEGEHALGGEQAAEHVADEPRVVGPVHPELELLDDAGRDAQREDQAVDLGPEERELAPLRVLRPEVRPDDDQEHQAQAHREGREDEVEARRQRELDPGQQLRIHGRSPLPLGLDPRPALAR